MSTGDHYWLSQMITIIERAQRISDRGEAAFFDQYNPVEFLAARMIVVELDVAAEHVSDGFKHRNPDLPWDEIARTRDKYAHHYEDIDRSIVWALITDRLPTLGTTLQARLLTLE